MAILFLLALALLSVSAFALSDDSVTISNALLPSVELKLSRNISTHQCTVVKLLHDVSHKHVRDAHGVTEVRKNVTTGASKADLLAIYAWNEDRAWDIAHQQCEDDVLYPHDWNVRTDELGPQLVLASAPLDIDVRPILVSGSSSNRVDFMLLGDGYTRLERTKFFADAKRLIESIALREDTPFGSVKGLVNWWAGFVPSKESGIGTGGRPKDTVFGLFRPGTELRGVYWGKPDQIKQACRQLGQRCDYPIVMGNSPFFGGGGGDITTVTASILNGPLVLPHELGHSVLPVGDEYDDGGYLGANTATSLDDLGWTHWLTDPVNLRVERSSVPLLVYPWTLLRYGSPWRVTFETTGTFPRNALRFSLSGIPNAAQLIIRLDGQRLHWLPKTGIGRDRWFYLMTQLGGPHGLREGQHVLDFQLTKLGRQGEAQLCSLEIIEYGTEEEFNSASGFIGAFPTYSDEDSPSQDASSVLPKQWNSISLRPTNENCLMRRQETAVNFCAVCKEQLWLRLLSRVDLIEDVSVSCHKDVRTIKLHLVKLPHLSIEWKKDSAIVPELEGMTEVFLWEWDSMGIWDVTVIFQTNEIRMDRQGVSSGHRRLDVLHPCRE